LLESDGDRVWRPVKVFITFQTLLGFRWAIKNKIREGLRSDTPLVQDLINERFVLERCQSPHTTIWENKHITRKVQIKKSLIFVLILLGYLLFCTVLVLSVKDGLSAVRHRYYFGPYCPEIKEMFTDMETFH
jgi:hypothetical protein